jgi:MarR family transcriptional regulator for hemolysin
MKQDARRILGIRLVGLARRWRQYLDAQLSLSGLSDATWAPLVHLHRAGDEVLQKDLAARLGLDVSSLVRLLDILEARHLVERRPDPVDRRAKRIVLTPAGHAQVALINRMIAPLEDDLLQDLDQAEIEAMLRGFERIENRLAQPAEKSQP